MPSCSLSQVKEPNDQLIHFYVDFFSEVVKTQMGFQEFNEDPKSILPKDIKESPEIILE